MKKFLLAAIIGTMLCPVYAQNDLIRVKKKDKLRSLVEIYTVLQSNSDIKCGDYTRFIHKKKVASGQYTNNKETGIWTFYNRDNSICWQYDYDKDSAMFVDIQDDTSGLDRPPLYLGSPYETRYIVATNLRYPEKAAENGLSDHILIDIYIDKNGNVFDYRVHDLGYELLDKEALRVVKLLPERWLPAIKDGKPIDYIYSYPVNFILQ